MDALNIKKVMGDKNISIDAIAATLDIHRNTAANKIAGHTPFSVQEAFKLKSDLFPEYDVDYLFSPLNGGSQNKIRNKDTA